ncbi:MAG: methylmalonyl-CoA mutase subunit beta, partial [Bacteroidales bacterium]|nr:methylmalonyl-CoA mutase subunit beta [Bacteroidales bacterium]
PPVTAEEWTEKINATLKGESFDNRLMWKTGEGFDVKPFYTRKEFNNLIPVPFRKDGNQWLVRQNIAVTGYPASNKKALELLEKGVDSLGFILPDPDTITEKNLKVLLDGIEPEKTEINFLSNGKAREILEIITGITDNKKCERKRIRGAIETDPLGRLMINGTLCISTEAGFDYLAELVKDSAMLPSYRVIHVNGLNFRNAGAGIAQELAYTMSMVCEYLSQLTGREIDPGFAASRIRLGFGTGSEYFLEIAKLRASRILWPVIIKGFIDDNSEIPEAVIHCETTRWNKTIYDPYVNMLRTQTEAMSSVIGGADSVTVSPFNIAFSTPDEFAERIARNQQLILREEAFFGKTADPSAGSWYIGNLTNLAAEQAWKLFLEVEERGGFLSALKEGFIQDRVEESAGKRKDEILNGRELVLGLNYFPDPDERIEPSFFEAGVSGSDIKADDLQIRPLKLSRGAADAEKSRAEKTVSQGPDKIKPVTE